MSIVAQAKQEVVSCGALDEPLTPARHVLDIRDFCRRRRLLPSAAAARVCPSSATTLQDRGQESLSTCSRPLFFFSFFFFLSHSLSLPLACAFPCLSVCSVCVCLFVLFVLFCPVPSCPFRFHSWALLLPARAALRAAFILQCSAVVLLLHSAPTHLTIMQAVPCVSFSDSLLCARAGLRPASNASRYSAFAALRRARQSAFPIEADGAPVVPHLKHLCTLVFRILTKTGPW